MRARKVFNPFRVQKKGLRPKSVIWATQAAIVWLGFNPARVDLVHQIFAPCVGQ